MAAGGQISLDELVTQAALDELEVTSLFDKTYILSIPARAPAADLVLTRFFGEVTIRVMSAATPKDEARIVATVHVTPIT
jgi:hypothetical protein